MPYVAPFPGDIPHRRETMSQSVFNFTVRCTQLMITKRDHFHHTLRFMGHFAYVLALFTMFHGRSVYSYMLELRIEHIMIMITKIQAKSPFSLPHLPTCVHCQIKCGWL